MKKRIAAGVVCLAIAAVTISGSLAYFTADSIATNVITSGDINIAVKETELSDNGQEATYEGPEGKIMPGDNISKIVRVHNTGSNTAYVRVALDKLIELNNGDRDEAGKALIICMIGEDVVLNNANWTYKEDGYFYYNHALEPGESTSPLFDSVKFSEEMSNAYKGCNITINVIAEGVQVANNGNNVFDAAGWPTDVE